MSIGEFSMYGKIQLFAPSTVFIIEQYTTFNPILHTAWLDNHALTLKSNLQNIIFMKNPDFCIPS